MDCGHLHELSQWFDGELAPEGKARFEEHMAGCAACRRARGELLALRDGLRRDDPGVDPAEQRRVLERILASGRPPLWRRSISVPAPLLAAGALALLILAGLALREPAPPGPPAGEPERTAAPGAESSGESAPAVLPPGEAPGLHARDRDPAAAGLARFDHGGRALLYKIPRPGNGEAIR